MNTTMENVRPLWCAVAILLILATGCNQTPSSEIPSTAGPQSSLPVGSALTNQALAEDERPVIVAFGNSLTAGLGVALEESYPVQLERRLRAAGYPYRVINAGVSGETTAGGLRRVDGVLRYKPDIVILELGANDGLRGIGLAQIRANLDRIIRRLKEAGSRVILAGMKLPPNYGPVYTKGFSAMYAELAQRHKTALIPFFLEGVAARPEFIQADGLHPNAEGYRVIVETLWPDLLPALERATH